MSTEHVHSGATQTIDQTQARVDLTAALRWADRQNLSEGVCNHFSLALPGTLDRFLLNPQGIHWSEMCASDLIVVDAAGQVSDGKHTAEPSAFFIHSSVHRSRPSAKCVLHAHPPYCTALSCLDGGRLEMCSQNAIRFYGRVACDDTYNGAAFDDDEGDRISSKLQDRDVLFMANHGVLVTGDSIATAFDDLYYLERAAMTQIIAMSAGRPLRIIPDDVCQMAYGQFGAESEQAYHFLEAIKRILMRECPEFLE
ncbi:MAG: aldolase [Fuerstiella sp.]|jgi:ribulose-5-phosphate 4-epimerase/fuculose-1-phosphate aldolase|nr:aldolase [Fuerstiella sp.]MCP4508587.1 aldolase [Fuerstiella sp.]MDG2130664.1 aldolase [Fuerstiella sp.]